MADTEQGVVAIHTLPRTSTEKVLALYEDIYDYVEGQGGKAVITRDPQTFDEEKGTFSRFQTIERQGESVKLVLAIGEIAVNAALNKSGKLDSENIPLLNHPRLRNTCANKWLVRSLMPEAYAETLLVRSNDRKSLESAIEAIPGESAVIKRNKGLKSKQVFIGAKLRVLGDVKSAMDSGNIKSDDDLLVEAYTDTTDAMPSVRGINEEHNALLSAERPKELRLYMVDNQVSLGVVRVRKPGENPSLHNSWVFIDQDSIPNEARILATEMVNRIRQRVNAPDNYIGVDLYWDSSLDSWKIRECNGRDPVYIKHKRSPELARHQRRDLGKKLLQMADRHRQAVSVG